MSKTLTKKPNASKEQIRVNAWNQAYPIGTPVVRQRFDGMNREAVQTKTRSEAWLHASCIAVVMVEGKSDCVALRTVMPVAEEDRYWEMTKEMRERIAIMERILKSALEDSTTPDHFKRRILNVLPHLCDHKFVDSKVCLKCGWRPPT